MKKFEYVIYIYNVFCIIEMQLYEYFNKLTKNKY